MGLRLPTTPAKMATATGLGLGLGPGAWSLGDGGWMDSEADFMDFGVLLDGFLVVRFNNPADRLNHRSLGGPGKARERGSLLTRGGG